MKRFLIIPIAWLYLANASATDDKTAVTISSFEVTEYSLTKIYVTHACEWYRNSVDSTMIYIGLLNTGSTYAITTNETWWGTPQDDRIRKIDFTGLSGEIIESLSKYSTPTQTANIPSSRASTTLVIPDSLFVDCPPGETMPNFFTGEQVNRIGFPIVSIGDKAFSNSYYPYIQGSSYSAADPFFSKITSGEFIRFKGINKMNLPSSIIKIGDYAFKGSPIKEINLENVVYIGAHAFEDCKNLKTVDLSSAIKIDIDAFNGVNIDTLIIRQNSLNAVPAVFRNASINYLDYDLPVKSAGYPITNYPYTSYFSSGGNASCEVYVNTVKIGDKTTEIVSSYFCSDMPSLRTLILGKNLRKIPNGSFLNTGLKEIYAYSTEPYFIDEGGADEAFSGVDKSNCILYVPQGCAWKYEMTPVLQDFIIKEMDTGCDGAKIDMATVTKVEYYDFYGRRLSEPQCGQVVVRITTLSDGTIVSSKILAK